MLPPVYMCGRGGGERGECGLRSAISVVIQTQIRHSRGLRETIPVWVAITGTPVYMRERGGGGRGECGLRNSISVITDAPVYMCGLRSRDSH